MIKGAYMAIDPGNDTGWAVFVDRDHLIACGLGDPLKIPDLDLVRYAIVEKPKIYNARNMKGNPNDIVTLALGAGEYVGVLRHLGIRARYVTPHEWKGTAPKEINNIRTMESLSAGERVIVRAAAVKIASSKQHNMLDAIGLGLAGFDMHLWP
jgi:hypothetical protein